MIDYHCHILPRIDDGSKTLEDSLAMARQLVIAGFRHVYCTPHCITGLYDLPVSQISASVVQLQQAVTDSGIPLLLEAGMEYYSDGFFFDRLRDPMLLGDSNLLLFELPSSGDAELLPEAVSRILSHGLTPVLAHPERYFASSRNRGSARLARRLRRELWFEREISLPTLLLQALDMGCLLQADLGSFNGTYGKHTETFAWLLQDRGLYTYYGSDGHSPAHLERVLRDNKALLNLEIAIKVIHST
ncbi:MAG: CpsB/CapC family capsule biosynthesis tyrosine phosphatase [Desulfuromonadaceae bacterium]|nr:phosphoesterase [Desulfuromonas sp.]MDY0185421.1 CpsB/CapC family capsule biosynthesis tyrosine phosphatase [Desulfuromonadaceae bacterium]